MPRSRRYRAISERCLLTELPSGDWRRCEDAIQSNANDQETGFQKDSTVQDGPGQNDPRGTGAFRWKKSAGQAVWLKIGVAFLVFYIGEAILFWHGLTLADPLMRLPLAYPMIYPLGYWGLFGAVIYRLQRRKTSGQQCDVALARFHRWQGVLLTATIATGVIGVTFVVIIGSGSTTLGHVALFFALFLSAAVIGAMELNVGWLAAAGIWLLTAFVIDFYPKGLHLTRPFKDEDICVGLAVAIGFFLIGGFPQQVDRKWLDTQEGGNLPKANESSAGELDVESPGT
jgi:hypothetical protein